MALYAIDGTWSERQHQSNVYEFARRYKCPFVGNARFYAGPGTPPMRLFGAGIGPAMTGTGSRRIVDMVIEKIAEDRKHDLNVPIDIIGFSRGAAIANEVAWVLGTKGILRETTKDSTVYDVPSIRFLGLWDPVHSMGFPIPIWNPFDGSFVGLDKFVFVGNRKWCGDKVPKNVKSAFIIYSHDDPRAAFHPSDLKTPTRTRGHIQQRITLPGDHSDVGGHIENNRVLARYSLRKMVEAARSVDVPVASWGLISDAEWDRAKLDKLTTPTQGVLNHPRPFYGQ